MMLLNEFFSKFSNFTILYCIQLCGLATDLKPVYLFGTPGFNPRSRHTQESKNGTRCLLA